MSVSNANIQAQLTPSTRLPKIKEDQERVLQSNFSSNRNPTDLDLTLIAAEAGLSEEDVKLWYQHRLACWRQQQGLPANSRSIMDWWRPRATLREFVRCFSELKVFKDLLNTKQENSHDLQTQGLASSEKINSPSYAEKMAKGFRASSSHFSFPFRLFIFPHASLTFHSPIFYDGECYMYMDLFYEFWTLSLLRK